MTRDDYYNMAVASGLWQSTPIYDTAPMAVSLMRFVEMVAAVEREACAKVLEENAKACVKDSLMYKVLMSNAMAIRARGEK